MSKVRSYIIKPIEKFLHFEAAGGVLLLVVAILAFYLANSEHSAAYFSIVNMPITFAAGSAAVTHTLVYWVNDALMVLFFFVVGLEIKRELVSGELNTPSKALFPASAAFFGALVPAVIFAVVNWNNTEGLKGWGIPMATDIAFAVGVLTLFGSRVPLALKVFLLALAIVDDLIAVLVIAVFYTEQVSVAALGAAAGLFLLTHILKRAQVTNYVLYFLIGIGAWVAVFSSGVHATIAGVVLGLMTPMKVQSDDFEMNPVSELIHFLHPWVAFIIMPAFAFFNAGVQIDFSTLPGALAEPVTLGIILGLVFGKPLGIYTSTLIAQKLGWIKVPEGINNRHILAVSFLAGIGFTMSLFIGGLSYQNEILITEAKLGIFVASMIAGIAGALALQWSFSKK